jgi:hypothetical protein
MTTPEQDAAIQRIHEAIEAAIGTFPPDEGHVVAEWTLVAYIVRVEAPLIDDDGDEVNEYFSLHSSGLPNHAARGLLDKGMERLRRY